ncbi:hypothetical protein [uncultured Cyclobacterium sp.]|uniref:hypothetical protein n=1 Tax=uncultured Cyclobacterium sp. TaxID=453820 RepID=UPI0030EC74ED
MIKGSFMDIQAEKLQLIEWLAGLNDAKVLNEFIALKKKKEVDWWDRISAEEREEIQIGLAQADKGEVIPHQEVMAKYKKWL